MASIAEHHYDASCLDDFMTCPRLFFYKHLLRLDAKEEPIARFFGLVFHEALAAYYRGFSTEESTKFLDQIPEETPNPLLTRKRAKVLFADYLAYWGREQWLVDRVEEKFVIPMDNETFYTGIMDLVVRKDTATLVVDHKTTSRMGSLFFGSFRPSIQMDGYFFACRELLGSCDGIIVNGINTSGNPKERFGRDENPRSQRELDSFLATYNYFVAAIEQCISDNFWPMSTCKQHCGAWGGCIYKNLCLYGYSKEQINGSYSVRDQYERIEV